MLTIEGKKPREPPHPSKEPPSETPKAPITNSDLYSSWQVPEATLEDILTTISGTGSKRNVTDGVVVILSKMVSETLASWQLSWEATIMKTMVKSNQFSENINVSNIN